MDMTIPLSVAADRLGQIKATIAGMREEQAALEAILIEAGKPVVEGTMFRVAISHCDGRTNIDWQSIAKRFEPSRQLIAAHTSVGAPYDVVRVSARKS